jgi:hypothetical protein
MKNLKFIYWFFLFGVLFLITAGALYATQDNNLTPVYASIGFAIIAISFVLFNHSKNGKNQNKQ